MTVIIYTYPPDYLMAGISARMLTERQGLKVVLAIDQKDPPLACEFATVVRTTFSRQGNLNGKEFIQGHLRLMADHATGDYTWKLDSDTALINARRLLSGRTETVVGLWVKGMSGMNGCAYALRTADLPAMIEKADALDPAVYHMEDQTTGNLAMNVGSGHFERWENPSLLYDVYKSDIPISRYREHKAVVCFEVRHGSDRRQIARDMKRLYQS